MKNVLEFVNHLQQNNNKAWFDAHRAEYEQARDRFRDFAQGLIDGIARFDPSVSGIAARESIFRIYRDTRFSHNKEPYKPWMGCFICPGGKNSGYAGYYFHVEAHDGRYIGGHMLAAGVYMPLGKELESIRTEILDDPQAFLAAQRQAEGFTMEGNEKLKKVPKGFPENFEYAELLKYKDYSLCRMMDDDFILAPDLLERTLERFRQCADYVRLLNRAIDYAKKEM
ncbi:TIGR02453 family protein [Bacteroidia bacterium]|nr:TIGR02453 family protein [Bacteroidia bacterium]